MHEWPPLRRCATTSGYWSPATFAAYAPTARSAQGTLPVTKIAWCWSVMGVRDGGFVEGRVDEAYGAVGC